MWSSAPLATSRHSCSETSSSCSRRRVLLLPAASMGHDPRPLSAVRCEAEWPVPYSAHTGQQEKRGGLENAHRQSGRLQQCNLCDILLTMCYKVCRGWLVPCSAESCRKHRGNLSGHYGWDISTVFSGLLVPPFPFLFSPSGFLLVHPVQFDASR